MGTKKKKIYILKTKNNMSTKSDCWSWAEVSSLLGAIPVDSIPVSRIKNGLN